MAQESSPQPQGTEPAVQPDTQRRRPPIRIGSDCCAPAPARAEDGA